MRQVYALVDPRTLLVHWVGQSENIQRRLSQHLSRARTSTSNNKSLEVWIKELLSLDLIPMLQVLEEVEQSADEAESRWTEKLRGVGHPLANMLSGRNHCDESKSKLAKGRKGQPNMRVVATGIPAAKRTEIFREFATNRWTKAELAKRYGIHHTTVAKILDEEMAKVAF